MDSNLALLILRGYTPWYYREGRARTPTRVDAWFRILAPGPRGTLFKYEGRAIGWYPMARVSGAFTQFYGSSEWESLPPELVARLDPDKMEREKFDGP